MSILYINAAGVLDRVQAKRGSLKNIVLSSKLFSNKKQIYAVVCRTLECYDTLIEIIRMVRLLAEEPHLTMNLACIIVYDYLFGHGLRCGGKLKFSIMRHKVRLNAAVEELKVKRGVSSKKALLIQESVKTVLLPRYIRVNSIKATVDDVVTQFQSEGMQFKGRCVSWPDGIRQIQTDSFFLDSHFDDLLVFAQSMDLHSHLLYTSGHIILQGKASCLPAKLLAPLPGSMVIDACAAPGNKTSHLASLMHNSGKIFAFDLDSSRLTTMKKLMHRACVTCAVLKHQNFLTVNSKDVNYSKVEYILVDPSCSGSGCITQVERATEKKEKSEGRLQRLQEFQLAALLHAFDFQSVKRVVYSTCSVYEEENEQVVSLALEKCSGKFKLTEAMPDWPHRGLAVFQEAVKCMRTSPDDMMEGFFIAVFERTEQPPDLSKTPRTFDRLPKRSQYPKPKKSRKHRYKSVVD